MGHGIFSGHCMPPSGLTWHFVEHATYWCVFSVCLNSQINNRVLNMPHGKRFLQFGYCRAFFACNGSEAEHLSTCYLVVDMNISHIPYISVFRDCCIVYTQFNFYSHTPLALVSHGCVFFIITFVAFRPLSGDFPRDLWIVSLNWVCWDSSRLVSVFWICDGVVHCSMVFHAKQCLLTSHTWISWTGEYLMMANTLGIAECV